MDMLSKHTIRSGIYFMLLFTPNSVTSNYFTTATGYYKNGRPICKIHLHLHLGEVY